MQWQTLDKITRSFLLRKQLTMHWYVQILKYVADGFRERRFDTLRVVKAARLPVDPDTKAVQLPCDYVDFVKVGVQVGQLVRPLVQRDSINRLSAIDPVTGGRTAYGVVDGAYVGSLSVNDHGEGEGRLYGGKTASTDTFKIVTERGQGELQLHESFEGSEIVLEYVPSAATFNAATRVDPLAQEYLEDYADWQWKEASRSYNNQDRERAFVRADKSWRRLKARKSPFTIDEIREAFDLSYGPAVNK